MSYILSLAIGICIFNAISFTIVTGKESWFGAWMLAAFIMIAALEISGK